MKVEFKPSLAKLRARNRLRIQQLKRMEKPHGQIAIFLQRWVLKNFAGEGRLVGGWKSFKLGGRKMSDGSIDTSAKLLQRTGRLRASFTPFSSRRDAGIGSDLSYAKFHNDGTSKLPVRRTVPEKGNVERDVRKIYDRHVQKRGKVTGER